jgi:hypothetical protein
MLNAPNNPTLPDDILYAISCVQDYRDTIDTDCQVGRHVYDTISHRIDRLMDFYYTLTGFNPHHIRKINLNEID